MLNRWHPRAWLPLFFLCVVGCINPDVGQRPSAATANGKSFVDFHVDADDDLCWFIAQGSRSEGPFKKQVYQTTPQVGRVVRLPASPGTNFYRVLFVNRVVVESTPFAVDVMAGRVNPVAIVLTPAGPAQVQRSEVNAHATVQGTLKTRRTQYASDQSYRVSGVAESPLPLQEMDRMPYARDSEK